MRKLLEVVGQRLTQWQPVDRTEAMGPDTDRDRNEFALSWPVCWEFLEEGDETDLPVTSFRGVGLSPL